MHKKPMVGLIAVALCSHAFAFDWGSKAIQIEQQDRAGQWVPRDPFVLNENMSHIGSGVGEPDISVVLNSIFTNEKFDTRPELRVTCRDGTGLKATFTEANASEPWTARFNSACGAWRLTLVDTAKALRERRAALGQALPAKSPHAN
ncbi:hypothetical protein ACI2UY_22340 [Ralstonia nicotianae]